MKVHTGSERVRRIRRGVMELYLSDHPTNTLTSPVAGNCEFHEVAGQVGVREIRYGPSGTNHLDAIVDGSNPYFQFDPAKCIVCSRCVRACEEVQGTFALTVEGRGFASKIVAGMDEPFLTSECVSCGACVQACPTGSLIEKSVVELGQPEHSVVTTCAYCGVGCNFKAEMRGENVVRMMPWKDGKANHGHSCVKGRFAWGYANHQDRILKPMMREKITDPWREVTWDEAHRPASPRSSGASRRSTARTRSASSPRRAAPTKRPTWCRSWPGRCSATTTPTPARGSATRRPAMG